MAIAFLNLLHSQIEVKQESKENIKRDLKF